jgi:hypothetical protein
MDGMAAIQTGADGMVVVIMATVAVTAVANMVTVVAVVTGTINKVISYNKQAS